MSTKIYDAFIFDGNAELLIEILKDIKIGMLLKQIEHITPTENPIVRVTDILGEAIYHIHLGSEDFPPLHCFYTSFAPYNPSWKEIIGDK